MQKKKQTKPIILITLAVILLLLLIFAEDIIKLQNNKPNEIQNTAQAQYITTIGDKTYDITNAVSDTANPPTISAGMIPIKWDGNYWTITNKNDENWYNYANGEPAYIMLNDGTYQSELIRDMTGKRLAEENIGAQIQETELGTIYMWLPRFAYNEQGEIIHIKQGYSVAGNWTIPEIFTYETEKMDISLAGVWIEYNSLSSTSEVNKKINNMNKEESVYGFIANTKSIVMNEDYVIALQKYIIGDVYGKSINNITNTNRTILRITNSNQLEPIKAKAYYDETEGKIKIEVTYSRYVIREIIDDQGIIIGNDNKVDTGNQEIVNKLYQYTIIDEFSNMKEINVRVTNSNIYIISCLEDLVLFREDVNNGKKNAIAYQVKNINMNEGKYNIDSNGEIVFSTTAEQWEPIGNNNNGFEGKYNGNGYRITGLYIKNSNDDYQGLFGKITGDIQDIVIENSYVSGNNYVGVLAGSCNIVINVEVINSQVVGENDYVGGISGTGVSFENVGVKNCNVSGGNYTGGVVGFNTGDITNCYNTSKVQGKWYTAGITGRCDKNITNSYNTGAVNVNGFYHGVGGIAGENYGEITNCYNIGNVKSKGNYLGGIVGYGKVISNCYNLGNVEGKKEIGYIAATSNSVTNSYYTEVGNPTILSVINGDNAFVEDTEGINNGYPLLAWQIED